MVMETPIMGTTIEAVVRTALNFYAALTCQCPVNDYYPLTLDWIEDHLRYYYKY